MNKKKVKCEMNFCELFECKINPVEVVNFFYSYLANTKYNCKKNCEKNYEIL